MGFTNTASCQRKATLNNAKKMPHIAQFNDQFRDGIKGSTFHINKRGFAFGGHVDCNHLQYIAAGSLLYERNRSVSRASAKH